MPRLVPHLQKMFQYVHIDWKLFRGNWILFSPSYHLSKMWEELHRSVEVHWVGPKGQGNHLTIARESFKYSLSYDLVASSGIASLVIGCKPGMHPDLQGVGKSH